MRAHWVLLLIGAACWRAWVDIAQRTDAVETAAPLALVTMAAFAPPTLRLLRGEPLMRIRLAIPCVLLLAYAASSFWGPALLSAAIAAAAMLYVVHGAGASRAPGGAFFGLVCLALPVLPSFEYYLAYPMRVASAAITQIMLEMNGLTVSIEGAALRFRENLIQFDAPCSGVHMLWSSYFLASAIAHARGFNAFLYGASLAAATALAIFGNAIRAASLFQVESGLLDISASFALHESIGLAAFAMTALALAALMMSDTMLARRRT